MELLACASDSLILPPEVPGLIMVTLHADSERADVREGLDAN